MLFNKYLFKLAGTLLVVSAGFAIVGCENMAAASYGDLLIDKRLDLVAENNQEVLLLTEPSLKQQREFVQKVLPTNPGRYGFRRVYSPEVIRIDSMGKQTTLPITRQKVVYKDGITSESVTLDLLAFDTKNGRRWIAEPGTDTPQFLPNPQNPSLLLVQQSNSNRALTILDAKALQVKQANLEGLQNAIAKKRSQPSFEEGGAILYWATQPTWSPDGKLIAFASNRDNYADTGVWVHDVATGKDIKVMEIPGVTFHVHGGTADGRILARSIRRGNKVNSSQETVVAINPATKQMQKLAEGSLLAVSDDGKTLVYANTPNQPYSAEIYALSLTTGKSQLVFKDTATESFGSGLIDFSADGQRIVSILGLAKSFKQTLFVYDLQQQQAKRLPLPPGQQVAGRYLEWANSHLLVPLENQQNLTSQTLLMSVDSEKPRPNL